MTAQSSSYQSVLEGRLSDWESTLKYVSNSGYASSEESLKTDVTEVFAAEGRVWYREHNNRVFRIKKMGDIPGTSMHFRKATRAHYAGANSLETARVEALTRAIYSGSIRITGHYACVNHIGTYPSDSAPELPAETPVPIKVNHGQTVNAIIGYHEVTVAKKVKKKIFVCHIMPEYSPGDDVSCLNSHRIYFAGVLPQANGYHAIATAHYSDKLDQVHLGTSREVKTEKVAVTVLGLTNGLITTVYSDYMDGLLLEYSSGGFHTIQTSTPLYSQQPGNLNLVWDSDLESRRMKIFSKEQVKATWRHDTLIWLSDRDFATDRCLHDDTIQKAARQFRNLTLKSYASMIGANTLDIVAAYQRRWASSERSVCGNACYLFQGDGELAKNCIRAVPMRREQLEGVALITTPHGDYSLRNGAKVMYTRGEGGVWHIDSEGDTVSVPHSDLVGAETRPNRSFKNQSGLNETDAKLLSSYMDCP